MGNSIAARVAERPGGRRRHYTSTGGLGQGAYNPAGTGVYGASYAARGRHLQEPGLSAPGLRRGRQQRQRPDRRDAARGPPTAPRTPGHGPGAPRPITRTTPRGPRCSTRSWSRAGARWARSSTATISPTGRCRTPTRTACPSSSTPGASRSSSSAGRCLYHSDIQRGQQIVTTSENSWTLIPPYENPAAPGSTLNALQEREQDPLDVNQQLVAPAWWSSGYNNGIPYAPSAVGQRPRRATPSMPASRGPGVRILLPPPDRAVSQPPAGRSSGTAARPTAAGGPTTPSS